MTTHKPLLGDLQANLTKYQAGDRVICRLSCDLTADQRNRLYRAVSSFCGNDVNVLYVNMTTTEIVWKSQTGTAGISGSADFVYLSRFVSKTHETKQGVANIDLYKVEFQTGDQLSVSCTLEKSSFAAQEIFRRISEWAGDAVEIIWAQQAVISNTI